jgi:hypothetical protein
MKKQFLAFLAVLFIGNIQLYAQDKDSVVSLPEITVTSPVKVSNQLDNAFKSTFPNAENLSWYKHDKDYLAKFIADDMDHSALFKKNGYMKYDISYGHEYNLPEETLQLVKSHYNNEFAITTAINVKEGGRNIWVVHLEGDKDYVTIRIEDQDLEEVERYKKAS